MSCDSMLSDAEHVTYSQTQQLNSHYERISLPTSHLSELHIILTYIHFDIQIAVYCVYKFL